MKSLQGHKINTVALVTRNSKRLCKGQCVRTTSRQLEPGTWIANFAGRNINQINRNMEAQELRIGNYAMGNKPFAVDANHIAMAYNHEIAQNGHERFKSIPLTEDWLIRFGFELLPWGWVKKSDTGTSLRITTHHYFAREGNSSIKIESIHQLQNLYFALTGTELTLKN